MLPRRRRARLPDLVEAAAVHHPQLAHRPAATFDQRAQQMPLEARCRIEDAASVVESRLDQHSTRTDGLGIFGDERTLLRE